MVIRGVESPQYFKYGGQKKTLGIGYAVDHKTSTQWEGICGVNTPGESWTVEQIRPKYFQPGIYADDWLPMGRGAGNYR